MALGFRVPQLAANHGFSATWLLQTLPRVRAIRLQANWELFTGRQSFAGPNAARHEASQI